MNLDGNFPTYEKQEAIKQGVDNITLKLENKDAGKVLKSITFTANGTFTVPEGVTEVYLTGGGAGGGGAATLAGANGAAGGVTSFGSLLSINGGGGGEIATSLGGAAGGPGGQHGQNGTPSTNTISGHGGDSGFYRGGYGGTPSLGVNTLSNGKNGGYCSGGGGGATNSMQPGGGGGDFVIDRKIAVTPLSTYSITIGVGGAGGNGGSTNAHGGKGGNGILTVRWWE